MALQPPPPYRSPVPDAMAARRCETTDVAIVGGGPAGAAAALTLARYTAHRVTLIEASDYAGVRIGETVSAGIVPLLDYLGVDSACLQPERLVATASAAAWGTPELVVHDAIFSARGAGWHLNRAAFDAALAGAAAEGGATLLSGMRMRRAHFDDGVWHLLLDDGVLGAREIVADQVIDATGRRARFARAAGAQRRVLDHLVGLVAYMDLSENDALGCSTLVEATDDGWWYSAPLPHARAAVAFMTDGDIVRQRELLRAPAFAALLRATQHTAARFAGLPLPGAPRAYPAESQYLSICSGPGWVAAGDAAASFDPLSSLGIGHAIASGIHAARIADERMRGSDALARSYNADVARNFASFAAAQRSLYGLEQRFRERPFWARRHREQGLPAAAFPIDDEHETLDASAFPPTT
ncbi:FAD-dependent oxidoreductase [Paraburkholderia sp. NMBU_R16]|uniref:NAD(P)/FAD-dependent oxidoreductase n=1 Tax=Paraburkholderia sp. NMBU_R16 TaxID=2698676 RepID=UPI001562EFD5|nr:tryptophan 7-halogenase [Paraburkholderia sp. NMBU_R16]NRO95118.1 FAD-dependent oxidoreductase [Paraburkholderia sp. NMBU_R16]